MEKNKLTDEHTIGTFSSLAELRESSCKYTELVV